MPKGRRSWQGSAAIRRSLPWLQGSFSACRCWFTNRMPFLGGPTAFSPPGPGWWPPRSPTHVRRWRGAHSPWVFRCATPLRPSVASHTSHRNRKETSISSWSEEARAPESSAPCCPMPDRMPRWCPAAASQGGAAVPGGRTSGAPWRPGRALGVTATGGTILRGDGRAPRARTPGGGPGRGVDHCRTRGVGPAIGPGSVSRGGGRPPEGECRHCRQCRWRMAPRREGSRRPLPCRTS